MRNDVRYVTTIASPRLVCGKISDDLCLKTDAINMKKIGIDTHPSNTADLKDNFWLIEQFAVSVSC